jgi:serine/threonine protein kinase
VDVTEQHSDDGLIAGRYRMVHTVGQGGMGRVRRAEDPVLRREVALKKIVLPPRMGNAERAHLLDRIRREARIAAQLDHPGIVRVHDIVEHDGDPVIVMKYLDGRSLGTLIRESGPMDPGYVAQIAAAVADALAHAHAAAVVHRDLKPDNIVLTRDGRTVITDFGIARTLDDGTPLTMPLAPALGKRHALRLGSAVRQYRLDRRQVSLVPGRGGIRRHVPRRRRAPTGPRPLPLARVMSGVGSPDVRSHPARRTWPAAIPRSYRPSGAALRSSTWPGFSDVCRAL